jgi:hypothetical protein
VGCLCAIGCCVVVGGALWKLGNNGLGILLEELYVQVGEWALLPAPELPYAACGNCVLGVLPVANLLAICAND